MPANHWSCSFLVGGHLGDCGVEVIRLEVDGRDRLRKILLPDADPLESLRHAPCVQGVPLATDQLLGELLGGHLLAFLARDCESDNGHALSPLVSPKSAALSLPKAAFKAGFVASGGDRSQIGHPDQVHGPNAADGMDG
jgi:hypothetical protein